MGKKRRRQPTAAPDPEPSAVEGPAEAPPDAGRPKPPHVREWRDRPLPAEATPDPGRPRLSGKHQETLALNFETPVRADIPWRAIESLFGALGARVMEGRGSRVRIFLNDQVAVFHRPHPENVTDKGAVRSVRRYLTHAGVTP
jgi:hypothetical protein